MWVCLFEGGYCLLGCWLTGKFKHHTSLRIEGFQPALLSNPSIDMPVAGIFEKFIKKVNQEVFIELLSKDLFESDPKKQGLGNRREKK